MLVALTIPKPGKQNRKVGLLPVSTTTAASCPDSCPLKGNGCYADAYPLRGRWEEVTDGRRGVEWDAFCALVAALPEGQEWRHNQAGDLPGESNTIDRPKLRRLVRANRGKRGYTYTHKPVIDNAANAAAVKHANANGFVINLSANTLAEADTLANLSIAPVVVVIDREEGQRYDDIRTPEGRRVVTCPATYREDIDCKRCMLCQRVKRQTVVGFPAHGAGKKKARAVAAGGIFPIA